MIMAITTTQNWEAHVIDVVTAFLHVVLKDELVMYIRPPPGYEEYDDKGCLLYWLLLAALYGLKQSNRLWYNKLSRKLLESDFHPLSSHPCVLRNKHGEMYIVWVDDIIVIAPNLDRIAYMKIILFDAYEIRDLGEL